MKTPHRILVIGDINVDVLLPIESYPEPGGDRRSERMVTSAGGSAANCAIALSKLGASPKLLACVGDDPWAAIARSTLISSGVDVSALQQVADDGTGMMFIPITPNGQRTLIGRRGANRHLRLEGPPWEAGSPPSALHLSGYAFEEEPQAEAARMALHAAVQSDLFVSLDTAYRPAFSAQGALTDAIPHTSLLILGEPEACSLTGSNDAVHAADALLAAGAERVAIKRGPAGASLYGRQGSVHWPAFEVNTVDTTGAGDAFSAGLLYGLLSGLPDAAAALLASACGALATTVWGAGASMPEPAAIARLLSQSSSKGDVETASLQAALELLQA